MLTAILAHSEPLVPSNLWQAWEVATPAMLPVVVLATWYAAGRRARLGRGRAATPGRDACFVAGTVVLIVALASPIDALGASLASAHMVQHLLLTVVAAPLLARAAPGAVMLAALPPPSRRRVARFLRGTAGAGLRGVGRRFPVGVAIAQVAVLWIWHGAGPYGLALEVDLVHAAEHATFLLTAYAFWAVVFRLGRRGEAGLAVLLLFGTATTSGLLAALLTFARAPWYDQYRSTTAPWGLTTLEDQQLAGVVMWVPGQLPYLGAALWLLIGWIGGGEPADHAGRRGAEVPTTAGA